MRVNTPIEDFPLGILVVTFPADVAKPPTRSNLKEEKFLPGLQSEGIIPPR